MTKIKQFEIEQVKTAWCPGCGNFMILKALQQALKELSLKPQQVVIVSGIGQAAKTPHYLNVNMFNGLHGRALPPATAIKACNPELTVIAEGGDGDMYGEGGNHFLHTIRRNPNIAHLVHNNMVYGLTKGQASPTSEFGFKTPVQTNGVISEPVNPLALAISMGASFVARVFCGDTKKTADIIKKAIQHSGYALVDIFQPCVTFNKVNTFKWFKEHTYDLEDHDSHDRNQALSRAMEKEKLPLGIFYQNEDKKPFEQQLSVHENKKTPFIWRELNQKKLKELLKSKQS
jgi:2-oxoglutarate/2-oxoacid ferredoxin oxidoreductase subunit beta